MKKEKRIRSSLIVFVLLGSIFFACEKESLKPTEVSVVVQNSENAIIPYDFDWEDPNLNWMPYPAGQKQISVPWTGQGSLFGVISDDVLADRKKSDGWKLVYNTFSPTDWNPNPFFILYNEYRGLLRVYQHVNDLGTFAQSTYLQDGIYQSNVNIKLLNFADKEIVDASSNTLGVDRVQPEPFNESALANDKWYFLQYEIAYDPSIVPTTATNPPQMSYYLNSINISQVSLGGSIEGTINGTIGGSKTSTGSNFWNAATPELSPALKSLGTAGLSAIGVQAIDNNTTSTNGDNMLGVNKAVWKALKSGMEAALNSSTSSLPGAVVNVLSAIITGSSSTGQTANLTLTANLQVDGTQVGKGSLPSQPVSFYIPGSIAQNSSGGYNVQGYVPLYNKPLGVFNLANKPTIQISKSKHPLYGGLYAYNTSYSIKPGTLNIQWNPIVNGQSATIENVKTEIIAVIGNSYKTTWGSLNGGRVESVQGEYTVTQENSLYTSHVTTSSIPAYASPQRVYLRVSFVVDPANGAPESAIIKTFAVNQEVTSY